MIVSVVIPVYNEAPAIYELLRRITQARLPADDTMEIVIIDDGSTDETIARIEAFMKDHPKLASSLKFHQGLVNHGKGAALRAGFKLAQGEVILIQDGDLEYSPDDYETLLAPFKDPGVHIVYGSRFINGSPKGMKIPNLIANKILTYAVRLLYRQNLTDEATGYKVFRKSVLDHVVLKSKGFEFCPEFTSRTLKAGYEIVEVPIHYNPRGILEGKKIKARDGFIALWWIIKLCLVLKTQSFAKSPAHKSEDKAA
jgi:glycosyltransferase involved in cell wall biosynthesis